MKKTYLFIKKINLYCESTQIQKNRKKPCCRIEEIGLKLNHGSDKALPNT